MGRTLLIERAESCKENQLVNQKNISCNIYIFIIWVTQDRYRVICSFQLLKNWQNTCKFNPKEQYTFSYENILCVYKRISDCILSKTFLERVNKILMGFFFFIIIIVEPLREPFPYLKTDWNQNHSYNFSDMEIWHFCIDFHCFFKQKQSNYIGDPLN